MTIKEIENYLEKESKSGNTIAISYLSFLKNSEEPIREYWLRYFGEILNSSKEKKDVK